MYSILLSEYEKGMKLVESKLRHLILNGFQKEGEDITNMWGHY